MPDSFGFVQKVLPLWYHHVMQEEGRLLERLVICIRSTRSLLALSVGLRTSASALLLAFVSASFQDSAGCLHPALPPVITQQSLMERGLGSQVTALAGGLRAAALLSLKPQGISIIKRKKEEKTLKLDSHSLRRPEGLGEIKKIFSWGTEGAYIL